MNCPVCHIELKNSHISGIDLDICIKCEGIWFDRGELQPIINNLLSSDIVENIPLQEALRKKPIPISEEQNRNLLCPHCKKHLDLINYSFDSNVFVDKCSLCNGIWTDKGELLAIAKYMKGNEDLNKYAIRIAESLKPKDMWCIKFLKDWNWLLAGIVGIIHIINAYMIGGSEMALEIVLKFLPLPLALIWLSDSLGKITGFVGLRPPITATTPGYLIKILGWIMLILPYWRFSF
ncbi:MAG: zf-TFIIB domain-containing protein [Deltaproteobacteria bacterium]|nr:zf-TFIIB domain-containing protein [Deltaproteobacteria bacterium]NNK84138.1 hypothetical protein [Desulfobacterales bacterium]